MECKGNKKDGPVTCCVPNQMLYCQKRELLMNLAD